MVLKFKVEYKGEKKKSGLLAPGVETYRSPSVAERIQGIKGRFRQEQANRAIIKANAPKEATTTISKSGRIIREKSSFFNFAKGVNARVKARSARHNPIRLGSSQRSAGSGNIFAGGGGTNPLYHGSNPGASNIYHNLGSAPTKKKGTIKKVIYYE
jgi:hypothetical protein